MASFPTSIVSNTDPISSNTQNNPDHALLHQSHNAEDTAIETKLGTGASTPTANKVLRATGTGASAWGQVALATDVAAASSADLRGVLNDETGTGVAVFGTSPSITTPQIATSINDTNGNEVIKTPATASAVNEVTATNAATGNAPTLSATGNDTNIDQKQIGKGTGKAYPDSITEWAFDFIVSGLVWSGDSYGSTLAASMTAGFAYISGVRVTIAAVTARAFTASKDTYIDLSSSGTITYTEVANNAASPALSANNIRIGIIVSGANIAAVGSVNQGQEGKVLPIASSIPYMVTDSLGNLICPRDPNRKTLGYRQQTANQTTTSAVDVQVTELVCPIVVPANRKIKITCNLGNTANTGANSNSMAIYDGTVAGTLIRLAFIKLPAAGSGDNFEYSHEVTPSATSKTYSAAWHVDGGTGSTNAAATTPAFIRIELA